MSADAQRGVILAIDTATTRIVIATGSPDGVVDGSATWTAGYRHGETLLPAIERFFADPGLDRSRLAGIVVGTGPGAFTGLRVGIATAKGLAHGLRIPLVGASTAEALIAAASAHDPDRSPVVLLLPAGPSDRLIVRPGQAPIPLPAGQEPAMAPGELLVAVDLDGRAPPAASERGLAAQADLGTHLLRSGAARLQAGAADELATLVPDYVTLPRGVRASGGSVAWSRDPR
jgi:tRNA threonylcarbamoyladenosine biosynthesis protein TsaB